MTYLKNREQDARLAKQDTINAELLAITSILVSEHKQMATTLEGLRKMMQAEGIATAKIRTRLDDLELEGEG